MKNIKLINKIAKIGLDVFDDNYITAEEIEAPDAYMVRSASLHESEFEPSLKAIARAGAGVNNIPLDKCAENGIVVFNTPGANANGVKELAIAALMLASRGIVEGIEWAKTLKGNEDAAKLVEKGKAQFAGSEIIGKTLGVVGLGAIGGKVANAASSLGMKVIGCDPFITVEAAWGLSRAIEKASNYDEIYEKSDYITLHIPATAETKGMINAETIAKMKDGVKIINLARADLVNAADLKAAMECGKVSAYVTDFPTKEILDIDGVIAIPHLGASTEESEENCAVMAANQIKEYLENGNIINSVNYPNASMPHVGIARICVLHRNIPNVLSSISAVIAGNNINIENLLNRSRGDYAYTMLEIASEIDDSITDSIMKVNGVIRVNVYR
ncbi:MAG: 3-phosphoglycerate dehydrogenase [Ruminococcaceae bacterium]|nr:3-phosphoglycerate dehydrogenase [Oscillospiraceae bacterium]